MFGAQSFMSGLLNFVRTTYLPSFGALSGVSLASGLQMPYSKQAQDAHCTFHQLSYSLE